MNIERVEKISINALKAAYERHKDNLEPAAAYGFFTQAGGVIETLEGEDHSFS